MWFHLFLSLFSISLFSSHVFFHLCFLFSTPPFLSLFLSPSTTLPPLQSYSTAAVLHSIFCFYFSTFDCTTWYIVMVLVGLWSYMYYWFMNVIRMCLGQYWRIIVRVRRLCSRVTTTQYSQVFSASSQRVTPSPPSPLSSSALSCYPVTSSQKSPLSSPSCSSSAAVPSLEYAPVRYPAWVTSQNLWRFCNR